MIVSKPQNGLFPPFLSLLHAFSAYQRPVPDHCLHIPSPSPSFFLALTLPVYFTFFLPIPAAGGPFLLAARIVFLLRSTSRCLQYADGECSTLSFCFLLKRCRRMPFSCLCCDWNGSGRTWIYLLPSISVYNTVSAGTSYAARLLPSSLLSAFGADIERFGTMWIYSAIPYYSTSLSCSRSPYPWLFSCPAVTVWFGIVLRCYSFFGCWAGWLLALPCSSLSALER